MEQELLKAIITDLHLAGIHDIPSNSAMDHDAIEAQSLINAIFNKQANTEVNSLLNAESFDEGGIAAEMNELFAALGSGRPANTNDIETIQARAPKIKKAKVERTIIDPRNKAKNVESFNTTTENTLKPAKQLKPINFKAEDYISSKIVENAKIALILPYKNETELKAKADFNLLENILKVTKADFSQVSCIFIDDSFKKATQGIEKEQQKLAQALVNELKLIKQEIILSFGQDCLDLASPSKTTIRQASTKALDVAESKKLLANYSLSAMLNTPKYKSTTWTNLLIINKI